MIESHQMEYLHRRDDALLSSAPGTESSEISLLDFLIILAEHKRLIFWTTVSFTLLATIVSFLLPIR